MRILLVSVLVGLTLSACSGDGNSRPDRGPGFAIEGSFETELVVHVYRFTGDLVVQLHPRGGPVAVEVVRPSVPDDRLEWCPVEPGFGDERRERVGACVPLRDRRAIIDVGASAAEHLGFSLVGDVRIEEATVTYVAADNFVAVDFP